MKETITEEYRCLWQCDWLTIHILITFRPHYFSDYDHLEIRSIEPENHPLPITETGYRSHFEPHGEIERLGGPVAVARIMLDTAAHTTLWKQWMKQLQQPSLF